MQNVGTLKLHWFETIMFNDVTLQHVQVQLQLVTLQHVQLQLQPTYCKILTTALDVKIIPCNWRIINFEISALMFKIFDKWALCPEPNSRKAHMYPGLIVRINFLGLVGPRLIMLRFSLTLLDLT